MIECGSARAGVEPHPLEGAADERRIPAGDEVRIRGGDCARERGSAELQHLAAHRLDWQRARRADDERTPSSSGEDNGLSELAASVLHRHTTVIDSGLDS